MDLLARGYVVEVVSPDAIPDNFADLELRVEADPSNDLTANVSVHDGQHSNSFNFVHHLKEPMVDFVRRPPETGPATYFPDGLVSFNGEPALFDAIELPPEVAEQPMLPSNQVLKLPDEPQKADRPITLPEQGLPSVKESEERHVRRGITLIIHRSRIKPKLKVTLKFKRKTKPVNVSGGLFLRWAANLAIGIVLAIVLARGVRREGGASSAQSLPVAGAVNVFAGRQSTRPAVSAAAEGPVSGSVEKAGKGSTSSALPGAPPVSSSANVESSLRKTDDLGTPEAAVYRDQAVAQFVRSTRHHKGHAKHDAGLIAADTVHYLDKTLAPNHRQR